MLAILLEQRIRRLELMFLFMAEQVINGSMIEEKQEAFAKLILEVANELDHENAIVDHIQKTGTTGIKN